MTALSVKFSPVGHGSSRKNARDLWPKSDRSASVTPRLAGGESAGRGFFGDGVNPGRWGARRDEGQRVSGKVDKKGQRPARGLRVASPGPPGGPGPGRVRG